MLKLMLKGFLMGAADLVPGISGGTVALITGIYSEFVSTIGSVSIKDLLSFKFRRFYQSLNPTFLFPLAAGIFIGILSLSRVMKFILTEYPLHTWAVFFVLVLTSTMIFLGKRKWLKIENLFLLLLGVLAGFIVTKINITFPQNIFFTFLAGFIGSFAMILPGISGSFILLIIGYYEVILEALHALSTFDGFMTIATFGIGFGIGILAFSRFLKTLLETREREVLLIFLGLVLGACRVLWPFGQGRTASFIPDFNNNQHLMIIFLMISLTISIIVLNKFISKVDFK